MYIHDDLYARTMSFLDLAAASGLFGWLLFMSIPILVLFGLVLLLVPRHRLAWFYFCFSWIPFALGTAALGGGVYGVLDEILYQYEPHLCDILRALCVSQFSFIVGLLASGIAIPVACLHLARSTPPNPAPSVTPR